MVSEQVRAWWKGGRGREGDNKQLFLEPEWALSQKPIKPKAEWAIDSEAMRARGISLF